MEVLILYKTRHGSTEEYAKIISRKVRDTAVFPIDKFNPSDFDKYKKIVVGSCVYAGKIEVLSFIVDHWDKLDDKEILLFTVGVVGPEEEASKASYESIPAEIKSKIEYLKIGGKVNIEKLSFFEKIIIKAFKPETLDLSSEENADPIIAWALK